MSNEGNRVDRSATHLVGAASRIARITSALAIVIGSLVLVGWVLDIPALKSILPHYISMKINTALCIILSGVAIGLLNLKTPSPWSARIASWIASLVSIAGLAVFSQYITGWDFGIDNAIYREPANTVETTYPGRMAPATALNFFFLGTALLLIRLRRFRLSQVLTLLPLLIAMLAIVGYAYGVRAFYGIATYTPMAAHTSIALLLISIGVLSLQPSHGLMSIVMETSVGGMSVRRLLPMAMLLPLLLGWLRLLGEAKGLYDARFGVALFAISMSVIFVVLILFDGAWLHASDARRRRLEDDLIRQTGLMKSILTNIGDGVVVADREGKFILWNPAAERILGLGATDAPPDEWSRHYGVFLPDRVTPYPAERLPLARAIRGETVKNDEQFVRNPKVPHGTWLIVTGTPLKDEAGDLRGGIVVFQDIREQKQREEERRRYIALVEAANKELEAFSYSVSHDLRAPLRAIDGFSRILAEDYADKLDDEGKRRLEVIAKNTRQMGELIDDLLAFSRIGKKEIAREEIDMTELAKAAFSECVADCRQRNIALRMEPLPRFYGDRAMMRQVFVNLISNSVKFTRPRPEAVVTISFDTSNGENGYSVRDNGVGFDMRYVQKLFGVFQRLHGVEEFEGTGVGLAIVQRIVHRHGGRVWAESALGEGSRFSFSFPKEERHDRIQ